jgi:hypothetical protein
MRGRVHAALIAYAPPFPGAQNSRLPTIPTPVWSMISQDGARRHGRRFIRRPDSVGTRPPQVDRRPDPA